MKQQQSPTNSTRIIWFGFMGAILIYSFVAYTHLMKIHGKLELNFSELKDVLFAGALALGVGLLYLAYQVFPMKLQPMNNGKNPAVQFLQFACSESIAILGVVLVFKNGSLIQFVVLALMATVSLLNLFPENEIL